MAAMEGLQKKKGKESKKCLVDVCVKEKLRHLAPCTESTLQCELNSERKCAAVRPEKKEAGTERVQLSTQWSVED